jgi:hypothetical protein
MLPVREPARLAKGNAAEVVVMGVIDRLGKVRIDFKAGIEIDRVDPAANSIAVSPCPARG